MSQENKYTTNKKKGLSLSCEQQQNNHKSPLKRYIKSFKQIKLSSPEKTKRKHKQYIKLSLTN